ncbi:hydrolase [Peribacillus sp. B-H-3]|uniref:hydrolase n=1 Tax=Peribacillus sp. B-H-3 TaxID=3400420 RepID=UPI003B0190D4
MEQRTFLLDGQWNIVYYPHKPSGFSVLIFGDSGHFVQERTSYWREHPGRLQILESLKEYGYTLFSSNFHGVKWESQRSFELAVKLYFLIMKSEILNSKIHILAEGTGALPAMKFMESMPELIRSAVFINPCLSVKNRLIKEKESKFFYKKWLKEASAANKMDSGEFEDFVLDSKKLSFQTKVPLKIITVLDNANGEQNPLYQELKQQNDQELLEFTYLLPEKRYKIPSQIRQFFQKYEKLL